MIIARFMQKHDILVLRNVWVGTDKVFVVIMEMKKKSNLINVVWCAFNFLTLKGTIDYIL